MFASSRRTEFGSLTILKTLGAFGDKTKIETVLGFAAWPAAAGLRTFQSTIRLICFNSFPLSKFCEIFFD